MRNLSAACSTTLILALAITHSNIAFAQAAPAPAPAADPAPAAPSGASDDAVSEIVVIADALRGQVDAPESKQAFGIKSARSLHGLCFRKTAQVEWQAKDQYNRHIGQVTCEGIDANAEQVRRGMAWVSPQSTQPGSPLYELEAYARVRGIGLWSDARPVPPWDWRPRKHTP